MTYAKEVQLLANLDLNQSRQGCLQHGHQLCLLLLLECQVRQHRHLWDQVSPFGRHPPLPWAHPGWEESKCWAAWHLILPIHATAMR